MKIIIRSNIFEDTLTEVNVLDNTPQSLLDKAHLEFDELVEKECARREEENDFDREIDYFELLTTALDNNNIGWSAGEGGEVWYA